MARLSAVIVLSIFCFTGSSSAFGIIDEVLGTAQSCEDICQNTYPPHTYDKFSPLGVCERGCRLFSIINFVDEFSSPNDTLDECNAACQDCYKKQDDLNACTLGCSSQVDISNQHRNEAERQMEPSSFYPLLYIHNMYSNMVSKVQNHISVSWSFYAQNDNGQLVVLKSQPVVIVEGPAEYKTSNYLETNLEPVDNSATPNIKSSQVHALADRDLNDYEVEYEDQTGDWLGCISQRTGLSRFFISLTLLGSAMVMIWLCLSSAVTAPDQRVRATEQKLSYYGDLDYLKDEKKLLTHPQFDADEAGPIPLKIPIEQV